MISEKEREALMRLTMCARNECVMCKYKDSCDSDVRFEFATKHMNILADALRKTESNSEIPNNCDKYRCYKCWWWDYDHGCQTLYKCKYKPLDKDINVRGKGEPQSDCPWK